MQLHTTWTFFLFLLKRSTFVLGLSVIVSCSGSNYSVQKAVDTASESLGCNQFKSKLFDSMYEYLESEKISPDSSEFSETFNQKIDALVTEQNLNNIDQVLVLKKEINSLYKVLIDESLMQVEKNSGISTQNKATNKATLVHQEHLKKLIEIELQDQSSIQNQKTNEKFKNQLDKVNQAVQELGLSCQSPDIPTPIEGNNPEPIFSQNTSKLFQGSLNVIATTYQSCQALDLPEISSNTPQVQGVSIYRKHDDSIGSLRQISSLQAVQETHPYIRVASRSGQNSCYNVYDNPLIYDYGGQAAVENNTINFFKDSGSGSNTLGIDCSAYVSSAIAAAGLRYRPEVENKAIYIRQNSAKFINAKSSGFTCFTNPNMSLEKSILPGDILAVRGHVVIIDKIGDDPFGLKKLVQSQQCTSLEVKNFDFSISQSSPSKNGLGVNRYLARDYFQEGGKMKTAVLGIAQAACLAYFERKIVTPPSTDYGLIRHLGTPECMAPKVAMQNESCVQKCLK